MRPTPERVRELLDYDPGTGKLTCRVQKHGRWPVGRIAGHKNKGTGYVDIYVDRVLFKAHRVAFVWMMGEWPPEEVDHINGDRADNRWSNLRLCNRAQNQANRKPNRSTVAGLKGVSFNKRTRKWVSGVQLNGCYEHLGTFDCPAAAHLAYVVAADTAFGEFARFR